MFDLNVNVNSPKELAEFLSQVYGDSAQGAVISFGKIIQFFPDFILALIYRQRLWVLDRNAKYAERKAQIERRLREIGEQKIRVPDEDTFLSIVRHLGEHMGQKELRDLFLNLLKSSMHSDKQGFVHPAFIAIISQLSPDEAKILKYFTRKTAGQWIRSFPIVNFNMIKKKTAKDQDVLMRESFPVLKNWTYVDPTEEINSKMIPAYLENLQRLGIINLDFSKSITDESE